MKHVASKQKQEGYFLVLAVMLIVVMGMMGYAIAYMYSMRAKLIAAEYNGLQVFYLAESGAEITARLLTGSGLVGGQGLTCDTLTGASSVTNASILNGTFTATAIGGGLYSASSTLTSSITSTSNSLNLSSTAGFAPQGRVRVGSEAIDYASISGNTLVGLSRGASSTTATSHTSGANASESICLVSVSAGIPSIASPTYQRTILLAIEILLNNSDIWAVGDRSGNRFTIARWNTPVADEWNDYDFRASGSREDLYAVSPSSLTNAWAAGAERNNNFTFTYWNGSSWIATPLAGACNSQDINGIATLSNTEAWAVGARYRPSCSGSGNYRYTVLRWNGSNWALLTPNASPTIPSDSSTNQSLNAISMIDSNGNGQADFGFAVGDAGNILRYNGTSWTTVASGTTDNLLGVSVISVNQAWAVASSGRIIRWNGSTWSTFAIPVAKSLNAISMLDTDGDGLANIGWAVGEDGVIVYYNGTNWATQSSPDDKDLYAVAALSSTSAWAVGHANKALQWNGTSWTEVDLPTNKDLYALGFIRGVVAGTGTPSGHWSQSSG